MRALAKTLRQVVSYPRPEPEHFSCARLFFKLFLPKFGLAWLKDSLDFLDRSFTRRRVIDKSEYPETKALSRSLIGISRRDGRCFRRRSNLTDSTQSLSHWPGIADAPRNKRHLWDWAFWDSKTGRFHLNASLAFRFSARHVRNVKRS